MPPAAPNKRSAAGQCLLTLLFLLTLMDHIHLLLLISHVQRTHTCTVLFVA